MKERDRNKLQKLYKIDTDSVEDFILLYVCIECKSGRNGRHQAKGSK